VRAAARPESLFRVIPDPSPEFVTRDPDGTYVVHAHAGQWEMWEAPDRFILLLAGSRSGKSALASWWLLREMMDKGPGQYLAVAPNFPIFEGAAYRHLRRVFCTYLRLGTMIGGARGEFRFSPEGHARVWPDDPYDEDSKIVFAHAGNPDRLEGAEYKAAWLDECGQRAFRQESWEAIRRRLAIDEGRALLTTTPYVVQHWIKTELYEPFHRRGTPDEEDSDRVSRVVSFESRMNPAFKQSEWDLAEATLPAWRFSLFFKGILTRPAGAVYDCFDERVHVVPRRFIPAAWARVVGLDFGSPNFAAVFFAEEMEEARGPWKEGLAKTVKTGRLIAYREYKPDESRTTAEHLKAMRDGEREFRLAQGETWTPEAASLWRPEFVAGGAKSETQWRAEFAAAGWHVKAPDQAEIEVGIGRVYARIKTGGLLVSKDCPKVIADLTGYSRPVDEHGNVLQGLIDQHAFHLADCARYALSLFDRKTPPYFLTVVVGKR
jgi:hypothetical protein